MNNNFNGIFYFIGYRIGIRNKISQHQKGRDQAKQVQIGNIINDGNSKSRR